MRDIDEGLETTCVLSQQKPKQRTIHYYIICVIIIIKYNIKVNNSWPTTLKKLVMTFDLWKY